MKLRQKLLNEYNKLMKIPGWLKFAVKLTIILLCFVLVFNLVFYFISIPRFDVSINNTAKSNYDGKKTIEKFDFNLDNGDFRIDTNGGSTFLSNLDIQTSKNDEIAKGINRITMTSQIVIKYVDKDSRTYIATSFANALSNGDKNLSATKNGDTIKAEYKFVTGKSSEKLTIDIPVEYTIGKGSLDVKIITDKIKENSEYRLLEISLLPYLGAASKDEEGYILVPDGSGALISFNNSNSGAKEFNGMIYGRDPSLKTKMITNVTEDIKLPIFGIKHKNSAMLAIVDQGDALCSITAQTKGISSTWNFAYFTYRFREYDTISLNEMGWNERNIPYVSKLPNSLLPFAVKYYFLDNEDADYVGMAKIHRDYLIKKENINISNKTKTNDVPFIMDVNMSVRRVKPVLGLPSNVVEPLTTFDDLQNILTAFRKAGAKQMIVKMNGFLPGGPYYKIPAKVDFERQIGGENGFKALAQYISKAGDIELYPSTEFINGYVNGNGFISFLQGNRDITGALSMQYQFLRSTGTKNLRKSPWNLITPSYSIGLLNRYLQSYSTITKNGINGIALDGYGNELYADRYESVLNKIVSRTPLDRQSVMSTWVKGLTLAKEKAGKLLVSGGNGYSIPVADYIINAPMKSSEYKIESMSVPYYQILTSGIVNIASTPVNFSSDSDRFYLDCLSTGTFPMYSLFSKESSLVKNTDLNYLYNGQYNQWIEIAMKNYLLYYPAYKAINGASIIDYKKIDDKSTTTFNNGVTINIDYKNKSYSIGGVSIND